MYVTWDMLLLHNVGGPIGDHFITLDFYTDLFPPSVGETPSPPTPSSALVRKLLSSTSQPSGAMESQWLHLSLGPKKEPRTMEDFVLTCLEYENKSLLIY